ncbi:Protein HIRA homolog [Gryllus bimaculatus]|nr:Protein HIRA homolog [Gryllus bimaculatus]
MKLLKPAWVSHDDLPIFSVDIHPDGSRFATGGQGEDSGRIIIWNMAPVVSEEVENDENVPKLLCQMDNHLACVNCVRWSFSGKFLASGGDDKLVMIWKISKYPTGGGAFGSGGKSGHAETWRCSSTLHGHTGDVLDMAWSPHDAWLASCSVDNTVIVWNALKLPEMVAVLKGHKGLVKGVAWDPVGKYVASQSDDKTLRVWRTADWQQDAVIQEPFEECGGTTHVLRLSWSPDGQYLVSAHAMNGGGPTAQIIEREGWRQDKDFVGHRKAVTCVRFNSNILQKQYRQSSKPQQYCCCAIGSRDCSLSVWLTALKRPLVVLHQLFTSSVLDLSWSFTGLQLMACSWDGSVAFVEFSQDELGKPLSLEEKNVLHERMYGMSLASAKPQVTVVETPELLAEQEKVVTDQQKKSELSVPTEKSTTNTSTSQPQPLTPHKGPINCQIETRTTDGKRRITPMFIPPAPDTGDGPAPFGSGGSTQTPAFTSSSESRSTILIKRRDDVVDPNVSRSSEKTTPTKETTAAGGSTTVQATSPQSKRMSTENNASSSSIAEVSIAGTSVTIKAPQRKENEKSWSSSIPEIKTDAQKITLKRKLEKETKIGSKIQSPKRARLNIEDKGFGQSSVVTSKLQSSVLQPVMPAIDDQPRPILMLPPLGMTSNKGVYRIAGGSGPRTKCRLEVENSALTSQYGPLTKVRVYPGPVFSSSSSACMPSSVEDDLRASWEVVLGCNACGAAANQQIIVVVCQDSTLHVLDTVTGQRLLSPLVLPAPASRISVGPRLFILAVTVAGGLCVWDVGGKLKCLIKNESLLPIMQGQLGREVTIKSSLLTENGCPLVSLSTGKAYMYSVDLASWLLIGDANDPVHKCASQKNVSQFLSVSDISSYPLATIQSHLKSSPVTMSLRQPAVSQIGPMCTVTYLEQQLLACQALESSKEYRNYLIAFARALIQEGMESRLRLLCDDLLGPAHAHAKLSKSWQDSIMGHSKHEILKEILRFMSANLNLQRLYTEYSRQLSVIENSASSLSNGVAESCGEIDGL